MFYQTKIKSVSNGNIVDENGRHLRTMNKFSVAVGDIVWTDGNVIFGWEHEGSTPVFSVDEGIPVLSDSLRGYITNKGEYKPYKIAEGTFITNGERTYQHGDDDIETSDFFDAEVIHDEKNKEIGFYHAIAQNAGIYLEMDGGNVISQSEMKLSNGDSETTLFDLSDVMLASKESRELYRMPNKTIINPYTPVSDTAQVISFKVDPTGDWQAVIGSYSKWQVQPMKLISDKTYSRAGFQNETFLWESRDSVAGSDTYLKDALLDLWEHCFDCELQKINVKTYVNESNAESSDTILYSNFEHIDLYHGDVSSSTTIYQNYVRPDTVSFWIDCYPKTVDGVKAYRAICYFSLPLDKLEIYYNFVYKQPPEVSFHSGSEYSKIYEDERSTERSMNGGSDKDYTAKTIYISSFPGLTLLEITHSKKNTVTFSLDEPHWIETEDYKAKHKIPRPVMFSTRYFYKYKYNNEPDENFLSENYLYLWHTPVAIDFYSKQEENLSIGGIDRKIDFNQIESVYAEGEVYQFSMTDTQGHASSVWFVRPAEDSFVQNAIVKLSTDKKQKFSKTFDFPAQDGYYAEWQFAEAETDSDTGQNEGTWQMLGIYDNGGKRVCGELPKQNLPRPTNAYYNVMGNVSLSPLRKNASDGYLAGVYGGGLYKIGRKSEITSLDEGLKNFRLRRMKNISRAKK